ncbi:MAG: DUF1801 domain-containing protein [Bacteroidota bacterium]
MDVSEKLDAYFDKQEQWKEGLARLRKAVKAHGFKEELKWGMPTYTIDGKNLIGLSGFKKHFGIWFHQGVLLSDPLNLLTNAQEGKTKGMRHIKFYDSKEVNVETLKPYLEETVKNHTEGKTIKTERKTDKYEMPDILKSALEENNSTKAFEALSPSKQNEYIEYIVTAKREATKSSRIDKILPMIQEGKGLNDKYKR